MAENKKEENAKKFAETELEKVDGGLAPAYNSAEQGLNAAIAMEERRVARGVESESEFRKQLEERGIKSEKKKTKERRSLSLNDDRGQNGSDGLI